MPYKSRYTATKRCIAALSPVEQSTLDAATRLNYLTCLAHIRAEIERMELDENQANPSLTFKAYCFAAVWLSEQLEKLAIPHKASTIKDSNHFRDKTLAGGKN